MQDANKRRFDYMPLSVRVETLGGIATPLVLRGTPLPATRSDIFSTASDQQTRVEVKLFLGESALVRNNIVLGIFYLDGIPAAKRGEPQVNVEFTVDSTCAVTARATLKGSQLSAEQKFEAPDLSDEFIKNKLAEAEATRKADELELLRLQVIDRARGSIAQAEKRLRTVSNSKLSEAVASLGLAMSSGNGEEIKKRTEALESLLSVSLDFSSEPFPSFNFSDFFGKQGPPTSKTSATKPPTRTAPVARPSKEELAPSLPQHPLGKIFGGGNFTLDPQLCFVLMPFDAKFQPIYEDHIRPTIQRAGLRCERADEIRGTTLITSDIWNRINRCRFLVAELTDQNANVFYELGLAHALGKDVILIAQSMNFVPFDIKPLRCIVYDQTARGTKKLEADLSATIDVMIKSS